MDYAEFSSSRLTKLPNWVRTTKVALMPYNRGFPNFSDFLSKILGYNVLHEFCRGKIAYR